MFMYTFLLSEFIRFEVWIGARIATNDGSIKSCQSRVQTLV